MNTFKCLGVVERVVDDHVYLRPLYRIDGTRLNPLTEQTARNYFHPRGLILWLNAAASVCTGEFWVFNDAGMSLNHKMYVAKNLQPLLDLIDSRMLTLDKDSSTLNTEKCFSLSFKPSRKVYLKLDSHSYAGPVLLTQVPEEERWTVCFAQEKNVLPLFHIQQSDIIQLQGVPERQFIAPWSKLRSPHDTIRLTTNQA